jgi:hypothetical protein
MTPRLIECTYTNHIVWIVAIAYIVLAAGCLMRGA